jgi:hypothetical protein
MKNQLVLLVGDNFANFGNQIGATTVSKLASMLERPNKDMAIPSRILIGQGVSESWLYYLKARAEAQSLEIEFLGERTVNERTGRGFAHKHQRKNILITDPVQRGINNYECHLAVDDDCEIMSDHTTGHHVQGMLLLEAARQTFLAVTEWFLVENTEKYYFVINRMDITYLQFAFPLPTSVIFNVTDLNRSRVDRLSVKGTIKFMQSGACVCEVQVDYSAMLHNRLEIREAQLASEALKQALASVNDKGVVQEDAVPA